MSETQHQFICILENFNYIKNKGNKMIKEYIADLVGNKHFDKKRIFISQECEQDMSLQTSLLYKIRTKEISNEEIEGWKESINYLNNLNIEEARGRVKIIKE